MKKCDVIIPIYNSPEWLNLCVYALIKNTNLDVINEIILVDDCSNDLTKNTIKNLSSKYDKIKVITQKQNGGFIKTVNKGFEYSKKSDYVLLLNTDCLISKGTIEKMISHMEKDKKIGLICPISSNAANLSLDLFEGFSYTQMNSLLEQKFSGINFDACTVVGNCLMISRDCINKVGYLDEAYGMGYGDETDYQFKAMAKGFKAKVMIDTYVFHKSEVSFGTSKEKQERLNKNRELFFSRWGKEYEAEMKKYQKNDPIEYIKNNLTKEDQKIKLDSCFYLNGIVQNAGGVHVVVDIVNYLVINGVGVNIIYDVYGNYNEIMLFKPIARSKVKDIKIKKIISTIYSSTYTAKEIADELKIPLYYFIQGYEAYFENGSIYGITELSYKLADKLFTISNYLKNELKNTFNYDAELIQNGINYNLLCNQNKNKRAKTITFILRNNIMKGDWIALDIIKKISNQIKENIEINVVYMDEYISFPLLNNNIKLNKYLGPLSRVKIAEILQKTDIYVDCSLSEGYGLTGLEALVAGAIPILSNSKGINDYVRNGLNGFIIDEVNDSNKYVEKIINIIQNEKLFIKLKNENEKQKKSYDFESNVDNYINKIVKNSAKRTKKIFNENEKNIIKSMTKTFVGQNAKKRKINYIAKLFPKSFKRKVKKIITSLYNSYSH